ncbi:MAG: hypothetical protein ACI9B9_002429 [Halioglobus sp.]|jgi:hypothetical protein
MRDISVKNVTGSRCVNDTVIRDILSVYEIRV